MIKYRHHLDQTGQCSEDGHGAEQKFKKLLEELGDEITESNLEGQFNGIDLHSLCLGTFDVKARKRINRSSQEAQDEYLWVEFKNVGGKEGWLYGKADYIAFERKKDFVIVPRKELAVLCESIVDLGANVTSANNALYKAYQRKGRKDLIAMIKFSDLKTISNIILSK